MNTNTLAKNANWFTRLVGSRNSVPGGAFCGRSGRSKTEAGGFSTAFFCVEAFFLLGDRPWSTPRAQGVTFHVEDILKRVSAQLSSSCPWSFTAARGPLGPSKMPLREPSKRRPPQALRSLETRQQAKSFQGCRQKIKDVGSGCSTSKNTGMAGEHS